VFVIEDLSREFRVMGVVVCRWPGCNS